MKINQLARFMMLITVETRHHNLWKGSTVGQHTYVTDVFVQMKSSNSYFELCPGCEVSTSQKDHYRMLNL